MKGLLNKIFKVKVFRLGEGTISGYIACMLAILSFLGTIAFHFPEYLTTPELRKNYDVEFLRVLMFISLIISGSLGLLNFIVNKSKRLGTVAWCFIIASFLLGGHQIEVGDFPENTPYLGLDWFILDLLGTTLIFVFIEKLIPYKKEQAVLMAEWETDLHNFFINHLLIGFVLLVTNHFVHGLFGWTQSDTTGLLITALPMFFQVFLIIFIADLIQYTCHRFYHEVPFMWRFHSIHHSVKTMDWLAGSRLHLLDIILTRSLVLLPIFALGFSKNVIDTYVIIVGFQAVFNHANVSINFGWLKYLIVTPQFHHWHHASDPSAIDRNYAAHFSFIDYVLGTAVINQKEWPENYGVVGEKIPNGMLKQQLYPFIKKKGCK
jgi:sterol desaturase/sphingolipid hydroxylase (fatty acid hydroxylase superfamily)